MLKLTEQGKTFKEPSEIVEVTQAQARAIEEGIRLHKLFISDLRTAENTFVASHEITKLNDSEPWEDIFEPLNSMSTDDLDNAIRHGYIVKKDDRSLYAEVTPQNRRFVELMERVGLR